MKKLYIVLTLVISTLSFSCKKFMDIVPDNIATLDNAFENTTEAEKYLFTCYSYLPVDAHPEGNSGMNTGDEFWVYWPISPQDYWSLDPYNVARGLQNKVTPYMDFWNGHGVPSLWVGIRTCNIFLENIEKVPDLAPYIKARWIAEVKFLKAYYHWYLARMYGPIPIADKNLPINASPEQVAVEQQPVDSVFNYIVNLLDSAASGNATNGLPDEIVDVTKDLGRVTRPAVLALKARVLVTAASPLFNGNQDYTGFKNKSGKELFNPNFDRNKWVLAANACREAIDACEAAGIGLYRFIPDVALRVDSATRQELTIRNAVAGVWNNELIWGIGMGERNTTNVTMQTYATPQLNASAIAQFLKGQMAPPIKIAEMFYTKNGVPIEEDKTWDYQRRFDLQTAQRKDSMLQLGYQTAKLHFDREPRFYAGLTFDGGKLFMRNGTKDIQAKLGQLMGRMQTRLYSVTGYLPKKLINMNTVVASESVVQIEAFPWPIMRLADLYLLYAEALNETDASSEAILWVDKIRERAGLKGVAESWGSFSNNPTKYTTKEGLRSIIKHERLIELSFEGLRFWDLRRWKDAHRYLNQPILGWDVNKSNALEYYRPVALFMQKFISPRDYLWPIRESELTVNSNLVQNPGW